MSVREGLSVSDRERGGESKGEGEINRESDVVCVCEREREDTMETKTGLYVNFFS